MPKANTQFKVGKNEIAYTGSNFSEWFDEMELPETKLVKLYGKTLGKDMNDKEILRELNPTEVNLADILFAMKKNEEMLKNGHANIFYVRDINGILREMSVNWGGDGWYVYASLIGHPDGCDAGDRVFSRKSFVPLSPDPFDLESLEIIYKSRKFKAVEIKV